MWRKITRIFLRGTGIVLLSLIVILVILFFAVQSYTFQTWLGSKAGWYLSRELKTKVEIQAIELDFFTRAHIKGIYIQDLHQDTLLYGNVLANIRVFDLENQKLALQQVELSGTTTKIIRYREEKKFNFQFIADYFAGESKDSTAGGWDVDFGELVLNDVNLTYRKEIYVTPVNHQVNFDDIQLSHVYGRASGLVIRGDTIDVHVKDLRCREQTGFIVNRLNTRASISGRRLVLKDLYIRTPRSLVKGEIDFSANGWDDYQDFVNKVKMDCRLHDSTHVSFYDISAFARELNGLEAKVAVSGAVVGLVNTMRIRDLKLFYGASTSFIGDLTLSGLPDIDKTYLHFSDSRLSASYNDLVSIPAFPFDSGGRLVLPVEVQRLGTIVYKGNFDGFISDFTAGGQLATGLGNATARLSVKTGKKADDIRYSGRLATQNFNLGTMLGLTDFNQLSMQGNIEGRGLTLAGIDAAFTGHVDNLRYNNYNYHNIDVNGSFRQKLFNGVLSSLDPNANFDFNGTVNFRDKVPEMDFISTINQLDLNALHFTNKQDSGVLSSQIFIKVTGDHIDNLSGQINFDNTIYKTKTRTFRLSTFNVFMEQNTPDKKIRLTSQYLNALVYGRFNASQLQGAFSSLLYSYYPTFFRKPATQRRYTDELSYQVMIKNFKTINELFLPDVMVSPNTLVEGNFNAGENQLNLQLRSSRIDYKKMHLDDAVFIVNESGKTVLAELSARNLQLSDSLNMNNLNVAVHSTDTLSDYSVDWDNLKRPANQGLLKGEVEFGTRALFIRNNALKLTLLDTTWKLKEPSTLTYSRDGSLYFSSPLHISSSAQEIQLSGLLSKKSQDSLIIDCRNVVMQQFNPFLSMVNLKAEGMLDGHVSLSNFNDDLVFNGNLHLNGFKLNDNTIGQVVTQARYFTSKKSISLNGYTSLGLMDGAGLPAKNISFNGNYYLDDRAETIDIAFAANPANLRLLNPFLKDIITINDAFVNGEGRVHGKPSNILIDGKFRLFRSEIKVDYTNVLYNVTGDIEVMPDQIRFSDLLVREKGTKAVPQGTINGNIFHSNFSRMQIDYDISYKKMLVLNTTERENSTFYGKVYGTGNVGIYGFINNLHMVIDNTTNRNSKFYLPLDGPAEIGDQDFIHFVKHDSGTVIPQKNLSGFNLEMKLRATPEAEVQIIFDQVAGDMLTVRGQGDLDLSINTLGKFEMFGDYVITDGDYLFTLENVVNKKFEIAAGSSIRWSGDPVNADIDVTTSYRQRVAIAPLLNDPENKSRTPVDCKLLLTGKLMNPIIRFEIDFPNIDPNVQARIYSVLSDEAEMNRQVFSFLLFRTFITPQIYNPSGGGVGAGEGAAATGSELLSNQVSEFLNSYFGTLTGVKDLQLGVNYRPGSQTTTDAVDLALSKQFLDNRVTVEGNFGVNNSPTATKGNNSNALIGDVTVDYKLSRDGRFRLKGFNRTNDNTQMALGNGPYTQGMGVFYRLEFETFSQVWSRFLKKVRREEKEESQNH